MRRNDTPGRIVTNFYTGVGVHDVITSANFYDCRLWGLSVVGGQILGFSIDSRCRPYNTLALPCECVMLLFVQPRPLLAVPNVTAHPSTDSVPITVLLYNGPLLCYFNVLVKGLTIEVHCSASMSLNRAFAEWNYLPPTKGSSVCLSLCLLARLLKKRMHRFGWNVACRQMSRDMDELITTHHIACTFEPDPDYSPDAGTGLLSPISHALQRGFYYVEKIPRMCRYWAPRAVGTTLSEVHVLYRVAF